MVISYYGLGMVKIQLGDKVIVFNPNGQVKFGADIALVSLNDASYNDVDSATRGERVPFVVSGPGEYEIGGVFIRGLAMPGVGDKINTVYLLVMDGVRLVHLGAIASTKLDAAVKEALGVIDVLFVPVGSVKLVGELDPKVIVPIGYDNDASLKAFLKEAGEEGEKAVESWPLKKKDLTDKEAAVVVIKSFDN